MSALWETGRAPRLRDVFDPDLVLALATFAVVLIVGLGSGLYVFDTWLHWGHR